MLRNTFKNAVKTAFRATSSMWFDCKYTQYDADYTPQMYDPNAPDKGVNDTYGFKAFDIEETKELTEGAPFVQGTRFIGFDFDSIKEGSEFLEGSSLEITEVTGDVIHYTIQAIDIIQQNVLILARLKPGGSGAVNG